ncbi:hypothetical protein B4U80_13733 [Leptotrombidium deliense]|uniref:J domain-containing protein n=1 Tax=Leptotrombidium deliense TaxID=299467 RepID=A0A443SHI7_9ACAR|nr:hypothetical protein B4U80_13733 [Leptotrombidium deliense]
MFSCHPDKHSDQQSNEKFIKINKALKILENEKLRNEYDAKLIASECAEVIGERLSLDQFTYDESKQKTFSSPQLQFAYSMINAAFTSDGNLLFMLSLRRKLSIHH